VGEPEPYRQAEPVTEKRLSMEVTFAAVNPELMGILTGGVMGTSPAPTFSLEAVVPVRRTFWQWLRRRPRQHMRYVIPNARLTTPEDQ
jgi:hypothetical protein